MAAWMLFAVALEVSVEQIVDREVCGPPVTPTFDQSTARLGSMLPDQSCAKHGGVRSSARMTTKRFMDVSRILAAERMRPRPEH